MFDLIWVKDNIAEIKINEYIKYTVVIPVDIILFHLPIRELWNTVL